MGKKYNIESQTKKDKWDLFGKAEALSELGVIGAPHMEIIGNTRLTLEGCYGVLDYNETYIKLKLQRGYLVLFGTGLQILLFENRLVTVKGKISSLEFGVG